MQVTTSESGEKGARTITLEMPCGSTVAECIKQDGEEVVLNYFQAMKKINFQSWVRRQLKLGKTDKEIQAAVKDWKPGMKRPAKSAVEKAKDAWGKLSPEERAALLKSLKG